MGEEDKKGNEEIKDATPEELEKALATALETIEKANSEKTPPEEDEEDEEEEEEEGATKKSKKTGNPCGKTKKSVKEPDFEELNKSIEEGVEENDEEASDALNGIPFVKALVETLDGQMIELVKAITYLAKKIETVEDKLGKSEKVTIEEAKLVKSISETIRKIGETPLPRQAKINQIEIIKKSGTEAMGEKTTITKGQAVIKLTELFKANKINLVESTKLEEIIQKGLPVPDKYLKLMAE